MADNTPGTWEERLRGLNECVGLLPPTENYFRFAPPRYKSVGQIGCVGRGKHAIP
jgi:hypothetical protein